MKNNQQLRIIADSKICACIFWVLMVTNSIVMIIKGLFTEQTYPIWATTNMVLVLLFFVSLGVFIKTKRAKC